MSLADARRTPFEELDDTFRCPQCSAYKKRFAKYDSATGKVWTPRTCLQFRLSVQQNIQ